LLISLYREINSITNNNILQSDNQDNREKKTPILKTQEMKVTFFESHTDLDLAFLATTTTLNLFETLLGKVIALLTLGF